MTKKMFRAVLALTMAGTMLASCGGGGNSSSQSNTSTSNRSSSGSASTSSAGTDALQPAKLRVWAHWGSEQRRPTINKIIEGFNTKYKDAGVEAEYVYVPFGELETKLIASVAAGNPANAVVSAIEDVGVKAMRKQAMDISSYLDPETKSKFYDRYWDTVVWKDGVYGLPYNSDTRMLFYNKTLLEKAGVKPEEIKTWDDMLAATEKVDQANNGQGNYKAAFIPSLGNFGFDAIATTNNAAMFDDPMNPNAPTVNSNTKHRLKLFLKSFCKSFRISGFAKFLYVL